MTRTIFIMATLALAVTLPAVPAQATGAPRTFVSAAGNDANNCTNVVTPCRHLATAYAATAANGEIYVLDPANYGSLTITGPVSIEGHGWASIAPPSGTNTAAITINANTGDKINIIGVVLDGTAIATTNGIVFNSGGSLNVRDSVIRNFANDGITLNAPAPVSISDTVVSDNSNFGINFQPGGAADLTLERVQATGNSNIGIRIEGENAAQGAIVTGTCADCVVSGNGDGFFSEGFSITAQPTFTIVNCKMVNNNIGLVEADSTVNLAQSTISNNKSDGFSIQVGGSIKSFGNNFITDTTNVGNLTPIAQR